MSACDAEEICRRRRRVRCISLITFLIFFFTTFIICSSIWLWWSIHWDIPFHIAVFVHSWLCVIVFVDKMIDITRWWILTRIWPTPSPHKAYRQTKKRMIVKEKHATIPFSSLSALFTPFFSQIFHDFIKHLVMDRNASMRAASARSIYEVVRMRRSLRE